MANFRESEPEITSKNPLTDVQTYIRDLYGNGPRPSRMIPQLKALSQEYQGDVYKKAMEMERDYNKRFIDYIASSLLEPLPNDS